MKTSIVALSYGNYQLTHRMLQDIQFKLLPNNPDLEIVLVENGSPDQDFILEKLAWWEKLMPQLRVIVSPENIGFGGGNNLGASSSEGEYLIFTQNDVIIFQSYIHLFEKFQTKLCIAGAELINFDSGWNKFSMATGDYIIPYIAGHLFGMNRTVWNMLGGFSLQYFPVDFEDVDLSMNALAHSVVLAEVPGVRGAVAHQSGSTANKLTDRESITRKHRDVFFNIWRDDIEKFGVRI